MRALTSLLIVLSCCCCINNGVAQITTTEDYFYRPDAKYGDVNADGNIERVYHSGEKMYLVTIDGEEETILQSFDVPFLFINFTLANVDDDPFLELFYIVTDKLYFMENESGKLKSAKTVHGKINGINYQRVFAADLNSDGYDDPIVHLDSENVYWMKSLEDGVETDSVRIVLNYGGLEGGSRATFCDYDQDGDMDGIIFNVYRGVYIVYNPGDGNFSGGGNRLSSTWNPQAYKVSDVNQDGFPDIIQTYRTSTNLANGSATVYFNQNGNNIVQGASLGSFYTPGAIDVEDFNNDGLLDIFIGDRESIYAFTNVNDSIFTREELWGSAFHQFPGNYPNKIVCEDIDDDDKLEWIFSNYSPTYAKLINSDYEASDVVEEDCSAEYLNGTQCYADSLVLKTQGDIDQFKQNHPDCKTINGDLIIGSDIQSLEELTQIQLVKGSFIIENNPHLENLQGLQYLWHVGDQMIIRNNENLGSLAGLEGLYALKGDLIISDNASLIDLTGLDNLRRVDGRLVVSGNSALTSISQLNQLEEVTELFIGTDRPEGGNPLLESLDGLQQVDAPRRLEVHQNHSLENLEGLNNMKRVIGTFRVKGNANLQSFTGLGTFNFVSDTFHIINNPSLAVLHGLEKMYGSHHLMIENNDALVDLRGLDGIWFLRADLVIAENDNLKSLHGMEQLTEVRLRLNISNNKNLETIYALRTVEIFGHSLTISNNNRLTSLSGMGGIDGSQLTYLQIDESEELSVCAVESICQHLAQIDTVVIQNNNFGCRSKEEVLDYCLTTSTIETEETMSVSIYPNPARDRLFVATNTSTVFDFEMYDHLGQLVLYGTAEEEINITQLTSALYVLRLVSGNESWSGKVIVE